MWKHRIIGGIGGGIIALAVAGVAVVAEPRINPDRAGEAPVQLAPAVQNFSRVFRKVADTVAPSVVTITSRTEADAVERHAQFRDFPGMLPPGLEDDPRFEQFFKQFEEFQQMPRGSHDRVAKGSGVIIDSSGVILTNNHVIAGADEVTVKLTDGRTFEATKVKGDSRSDIAVVKINADNLSPAAIGDSTKSQVGDWVLAIGSSFGLDTSVTAGIISAKHRAPGINDREGFIQTDAAINPGNSGGPLVNLHGQVIGINTAISSRGGGFDGVGFAIPVDSAMWVANQLLENGTVQRAYLGVGIQPVNSAMAKQFGVTAHTGVLINQIFAETPAKKAGLEVGDIIVAVNGEEIHSPLKLQGIVAKLKPGEPAKFKILRGKKSMTIPVTVAVMPEDYGQSASPVAPSQGDPKGSASFDDLGLEVTSLSSKIAEKLGFEASTEGVIVTNIRPGSPADEAGLTTGVVIQRVGQTTIKTIDDFHEAIKKLGEKAQSVLMLVRTPRGSIFVTLNLD